MLEAITIDSRTMLIKADTEYDLSEIIEFISQRDKQCALKRLFSLAHENRIVEEGYIFNRDDCYDK